jgi:hypothetical protein
VPVRAIAQRRDTDDVLFQIEDGSGRLAVVHLTWRIESDRSWLFTGIFESLDSWAATGMVEHSKERGAQEPVKR